MACNMVEKPFRSKYYHSITPPFSRHPRSHVLIRRSMVATGDLDNIGVKRISKPHHSIPATCQRWSRPMKNHSCSSFLEYRVIGVTSDVATSHGHNRTGMCNGGIHPLPNKLTILARNGGPMVPLSTHSALGHRWYLAQVWQSPF